MVALMGEEIEAAQHRSGKQILADMQIYRDEVHLANLERIRAFQQEWPGYPPGILECDGQLEFDYPDE